MSEDQDDTGTVTVAEAAAIVESAKPKPKPAAKPKAQKAALEEVAEAPPVPKSVTWRDLKLDLPDDLPNTFMMDLIELEAGDSLAPPFRLLRSVLGGDQFMLVRNALNPDDEILDVATDLIGVIFAEYGLHMGESSASADS